MDNLLAAGRDPAAPVGAVERGSTLEERVATGRLDELAAVVERLGEGPVLLFIGETARWAAERGVEAALQERAPRGNAA